MMKFWNQQNLKNFIKNFAKMSEQFFRINFWVWSVINYSSTNWVVKSISSTNWWKPQGLDLRKVDRWLLFVLIIGHVE